jgi:hypothetical protein
MYPFTIDAHGVLLTEEESKHHIMQMLDIQKMTGVKISLVFNNIYTPNDLTTMNQFIMNFKIYYEMGIRSITLPHILWMMHGSIKNSFPNLFIKSTVLRKVRTAQEFWNYANAGFDCVNIDRLLFRNLNELKKIKKAQTTYYNKTKKYVYISMVLKENCLGNCTFWEEHYQHTMTSDLCKKKDTNKIGFQYVTKYSGCNNKMNNPDNSLRRINFINFSEDREMVFKYIDIIKFGGRRTSLGSFKEIDYLLSGAICHPYLYTILVRNKPAEINILNKWRKKTRNCFYQCWNCTLCDEMDKIIGNNKICKYLF